MRLYSSLRSDAIWKIVQSSGEEYKGFAMLKGRLRFAIRTKDKGQRGSCDLGQLGMKKERVGEGWRLVGDLRRGGRLCGERYNCKHVTNADFG